MRIQAIAANTFRETIRDRVMINILLFAVGLILLSLIIGDWSLGQQVKVIKDLGLSAMSVFGLLIAVFIGIRLMVQELERRTIYILASKPVHRWEIVVGKFLGLASTLAINVVLMTAALWAVDYVMEGRIDIGLIPAIVLIYVEILLIVAFAIFFSSFISPTIGAIMTLSVFIVGHLSDFLREYVEIYPDQGFHWFLKAVYYIVPNLEKLNMKIAVVEHLEQPPHVFAYGLLYGLAYLSLILMLSILLYQKRDF